MRYRVWCDVTALSKCKRWESKAVNAPTPEAAMEKVKKLFEEDGYEAVPVKAFRIADDGSENNVH